jgi:hypothetical protein
MLHETPVAFRQYPRAVGPWACRWRFAYIGTTFLPPLFGVVSAAVAIASRCCGLFARYIAVLCVSRTRLRTLRGELSRHGELTHNWRFLSTAGCGQHTGVLALPINRAVPGLFSIMLVSDQTMTLPARGYPGNIVEDVVGIRFSGRGMPLETIFQQEPCLGTLRPSGPRRRGFLRSFSIDGQSFLMSVAMCFIFQLK